MAWEDRTPAEKAEARRAARERAKTDDNHLYLVTTGKGTRRMAKNTRPPACTCGNRGICGYCPCIAVTATREARLPAGSPGRKAADRIARQHR